ncbi:hypothetical protein ACFO0N_06375 [Halobium salinum]|uniref:PRC-barrel domain containing protein n=1 Tax=Halobium salinum TaxID=1364940 RepID=A0ABD5P9K9_9EURY|nr:hypothetical protein [Halobium salinum]
MAHDFTPDDVSKPVLDSEGNEIGEVSDVVDGEARLTADPDAPDEVRQALDVDDTGSATLESHRVDGVTDDAVRLNKL